MSVKVCFESILTSVASFEDRLNDLPLTFVLAWWDSRICEVSWRTERSCVVPSRSMMMSCTKQIHLTILAALLTFVSTALFNIAALLLGYQWHKQRTALLATDCNWKHVLHMTNSFSRKVWLGTSLEDRPHHQGWRKAFLFHFPQNLQDLVR